MLEAYDAPLRHVISRCGGMSKGACHMSGWGRQADVTCWEGAHVACWGGDGELQRSESRVARTLHEPHSIATASLPTTPRAPARKNEEERGKHESARRLVVVTEVEGAAGAAAAEGAEAGATAAAVATGRAAEIIPGSNRRRVAMHLPTSLRRVPASVVAIVGGRVSLLRCIVCSGGCLVATCIL